MDTNLNYFLSIILIKKKLFDVIFGLIKIIINNCLLKDL